MPVAARRTAVIKRQWPFLGWLPAYRRDWLLPDVLAGLAVWAVMVPEGMAYAGIVGVPPIMGLYTIVPPLIAYALLGTSRLLVVGPDTATGLISALTVGAIAAQGTAEFNTLTSTLAILIGAFFLLFGALRMGWVAAFIPTPVMRGFIEGLVCVTIIGQVPHLLGIERHVRQLLRQALVRAAASTGRLARPGADRLAQPRSDAVAPPPGTPHTRGAGRRGRGHDPRRPARRRGRRCQRGRRAFRPACLTSRCPTSTLQYCRSSHPARSPSCWSAMPRRSAGQRPRQCRAAATSIRTRS